MIIPKNIDDRDSLYDDLIQKCTATQQDRAQNYAVLRHYYLFGRGQEEEETPYNKIYPHIDTLTAFLFASETTKFSIHLPSGEPETEYSRLKPLNRAVNDDWLASNADQVFSQSLTWSLVYNSMFIKLVGRGSELFPFVIDPSSFGVLREDLPFTDRQEAMTHSYYTTLSQLTKDLESHPQKKAILESATASPVEEGNPSGLERILLTSSTPTMSGNVNSELNANIDYIPKVDEPLIRLHELWVWNDDTGDYQVATRIENGLTVYDRPGEKLFLKGENPFIQICANPMYSYYWGASEVAGMIGLQKWRNERVQQIKKLLNLQVKPPTAMTGWMGLLDEKQYAAFSEGSYLSTDSMQSKVERYEPKMPPDLFAEIREIDAAFAERSGLQNILMGKGEVGVRSGRQTSELARLSSARIKKRALIVEDALEAMATLYLKYKQKYDKTKYLDDQGNPFIAEEFSSHYVVKVDAHSNSPLFVEDQHALAAEMLQVHAISRERYIEIISPPDKELILRELKVIEKQEAEQQKQQMQIEQQKNAPKE